MKKGSLEAFLPKDSSQISGHTWNEKKVSQKSCTAILKLLNKHSSSFKQQMQDVRSSSNEPMISLAPASFFGFKYKSKNIRVELYSFSKTNHIVQVVIGMEKKYYFSSKEIKLTLEIEKMNELK